MSTFKEQQVKVMKTSELKDRLESIQKKFNALGEEYTMIMNELEDRKDK